MGVWSRIGGIHRGRVLRALGAQADAALALAGPYSELSDADLEATTGLLRSRLARGESLDEVLPDAFAAVREAARRTLGYSHYRVQLVGGAALHAGMVAEMGTGEGKTLVATAPAYLNALTGRGVHVVTVNDYLAARDAEWMGAVYARLGMSTGVVVDATPAPDRAQAYAADITYGTNNEFGFDYLRDNMAVSAANLVQRGRNFAIVDEVDSILIDEARTPLIISGPSDDDTSRYADFAQVARRLRRGEHYTVDEAKRTVSLTADGAAEAEQLLEVESLFEAATSSQVALLHNAVRAEALYVRDRDYVVSGSDVLIVDEHTGRVLADRRYMQGLHQAIEAKEGVVVKSENQTLAAVTLQNYFLGYDKLAGMTGTASSDAGELASVYGLEVVTVPPNVPSKRRDLDDAVFADSGARMEALLADVAERHEAGQPVLVGTPSVAESEAVSAALSAAGLEHRVLNAKNHAAEAEVIAQAGAPGAITVATNMAGRGTDIALGGAVSGSRGEDGLNDAERARSDREKVLAVGGLAVLGTARHESRRIDDQLRGRAGRQGDPGQTRFYLSLDDDLMSRFGSGALAGMLARGSTGDAALPLSGALVGRAVASAQAAVESQNAEHRAEVLKYDEVLAVQRDAFYTARMKLLTDHGSAGEDMLRRLCVQGVAAEVGAWCDQAGEDPGQWDTGALVGHLGDVFPALVPPDPRPELGRRPGAARAELVEAWTAAAELSLTEVARVVGPKQFEQVSRAIVLDVLDHRWRAHLHEMDYVKSAVTLRSFAQRDPLVEYRREAGEMFAEMVADASIYAAQAAFAAVVSAPQPEPPPSDDLVLAGPSESGEVQLRKVAEPVPDPVPAAQPRRSQKRKPKRRR